MSNCCETIHPLIHNGTSQAQRLLAALDPDYFRIDERTPAELVAFAYKFARLLNYYDTNNTVYGDWQAFFESDDTAMLAIISTTENQPLFEKYKTAESLYQDKGIATATTVNLAVLNKVLLPIYDIAALIQSFYKRLNHEALSTTIKKQIQENLAAVLQDMLIPFEKNNVSQQNDYSIFFNDIWGLDQATLTAISVDTSIITVQAGGGETQQDKVEVNIDRLQLLFNYFYSALLQIIESAGTYLDKQLEDHDEHQPHIALFIAFLQLFRSAQDHLNSLNKAHLDFYYLDVLKLEKKPQEPDRVHLLYELAKNLDDFLLPEGFAFKAGKDEIGVELLYENEENIVLNQATVEQIKTVYLESDDSEVIEALYANPVANSESGEGEPYEDSEAWNPVGRETSLHAQLGLAVSSPSLFLKEGLRQATIIFQTDTPFTSGTSLSKAFKVYLTTEEGWLQLEESADLGTGTASASTTGFYALLSSDNYISIIIQLDVSQVPITKYDSEIHEGTFQTKYPMLRVLLNDEKAGSTATALEENGLYESIKDKLLQNVSITTTVTGLRDLVLGNQDGALDSSKTFMPFGARPVLGATLYLGNQEMSKKNLTSLSLNVEWADAPKVFGDYYEEYDVTVNGSSLTNDTFLGNFYYLNGNIWNKIAGDPKKLFGAENTSDGTIFSPGYSAPSISYSQTVQTYDPQPAQEDEAAEQAMRRAQEQAPQGQSVKTPAQNLRIKAASGGKKEKITPLSELDAKDLKGSKALSQVDAAAQYPYLEESWQVEYGAGYYYFSRDNTKENQLKVYQLSNPLVGTERQPDYVLPDQYSPAALTGFLKMELDGSDFLHSYYNPIYARAVIKQSQNPNDVIAFPLEPYTPQIANIYLDYISVEVIPLTTSFSGSNFEERYDKIYHLTPFGHEEIHVDIQGESGVPLIPQFNEGADQIEGALYIGLNNLVADKTLSLLFQTLEGTADPEVPRPTLHWSYLVNNVWNSFDQRDILKDDTRGFITSGLVQFKLPSTIAKGNSILDKDLHWIRATIKRQPDDGQALGLNQDASPRTPAQGVCNMINIHAQAAIAVFADNGNDPTHLETALPAETISKPVLRAIELKSIEQPYASYGGRTIESDSDFYRRSSERLRHKNRALTIWDYERILLEEFPSVHKVKCISHTRYLADEEKHITSSPGYVLIAVIPDLRNKNAVDVLQPKVDLATLESIQGYVEALTPIFLKNKIKVLNPVYERVQADFKVKFKEGYDDTDYYKGVLDDDLIEFLSPWAFDEGVDITFGGSMHKSIILNFIEELDYVDFITDFQVKHFPLNDQVGSFKNEIITETPRSILTSIAKDDNTGFAHVIGDANENC